MTLMRSQPYCIRAAWIRPAIAATCLAIAGLLAAADALAAMGQTATNSGTVCFQRGERPGDPRAGGTLVTFMPYLGCLSSSCTEIVESTFTLDSDASTIAMTSRFTARSRPGRQICSADCMGGGRAEKYLKDLADGTYRLTLGGKDIGVLDTDKLDRNPHRAECFNSQRP